MNEFGFFLKQLITYFVEPFGIFFILFLIGIFLLLIEKDKKAKKILFLTFIILVLFSYQPFSSFLVNNLENQYKKYDYKNKVKYIHVLGGDTQRAIEGIIIHNNLIGSKLIFTGYAGGQKMTSAKKNEKLAISLGVKKENIILGEEAKDTKEEAMFIKKLLNGESFILVSSATHMPRAMLLFKLLDLHPIAAPMDFKGSDMQKFMSMPTLGSLGQSQRAMHEYLGILWSKLRS